MNHRRAIVPRNFTNVKGKLQIIKMICLSKVFSYRLAKDPVCGMNVDEKKSNFKSVHEGTTFYFCSAQCKKKFDGDPHKYGHRAH